MEARNVNGNNSVSSYNDYLMANYTSGMQLDGKMSAVRRFFCTFVLFEFLFVSFFWIICVLINGQNVIEALKDRVLNYSIHYSMFDVAVCAFLRFVFLTILYGAVHINHCWVVAVSTSLSCAFLIAKTLTYKWTHHNSYPFEVVLLLMSFCIAWAEAWFIDYRVLPQETKAKSIVGVAGSTLEGIQYQNDASNMNRVRDYLSHYTESYANFYSPLESPEGSEADEVQVVTPCMSKLSAEEVEMVMCGESALARAREMLQSSGWQEEKRISPTESVYSKTGIKGYKIYKLEAQVACSAEEMYRDCINNIESVPTWNKSISEIRKVKELNGCTDLVYQVSAHSPGNVVSPRDFITVRHWRKDYNAYIVGGVSIPHRDHPPTKCYVRGENGPNCLMFIPHTSDANECTFMWLLDVNLKGWIPNMVLHQALVAVMCDFMPQLRAHIHRVNATLS